MKLTALAAIVAAVAATSTLAAPSMYKRQSSGVTPCYLHGQSGHFKLVNHDSHTGQGTQLDEGTLYAASDNKLDTRLTVDFVRCPNLKFMGYAFDSQFGHVRRLGGTNEECLTATEGADGAKSTFSFTKCQYTDTDTQRRQWFHYATTKPSGYQQVSYVGQKNSTAQPYTGPQHWTLASKHGSSARAIEATHNSTPYVLRIE